MGHRRPGLLHLLDSATSPSRPWLCHFDISLPFEEAANGIPLSRPRELGLHDREISQIHVAVTIQIACLRADGRNDGVKAAAAIHCLSLIHI